MVIGPILPLGSGDKTQVLLSSVILLASDFTLAAIKRVALSMIIPHEMHLILPEKKVVWLWKGDFDSLGGIM